MLSIMGNYAFENTYNLTSDQLERLDEAEDLMLKGALGKAETMLLTMLGRGPGVHPGAVEPRPPVRPTPLRIQHGRRILRPGAVH